MDAILQVKDLCKNMMALRWITFPSRCPAAVLWALLGENGAGKSTTIKSDFKPDPPRPG